MIEAMSTLEETRDMTPEQASRYLRVSRETIYRYIRQGKLAATRRGRTYRIARQDLDLLCRIPRSQRDVPLRTYSREEIEDFVLADRLDSTAREVARRFAGTVGLAHPE